MQAHVHFLTGIFIQIICFALIPAPFFILSFVCTILFSFLSHGLLDAFAKITYHPPEAHWDDPFWKYYHLAILIASILVVVFFFPFLLGMFFATLIDIVDWGARALRKVSFLHLEWYDRPYLHEFFATR